MATHTGFLLRKLKDNHSRLRVAILLMFAISSDWMAVLPSPSSEPLRGYYGIDTLAAEFPIDAMLAIGSTSCKAVLALGRKTRKKPQ